jgi:uncharacterized membrane-anchored protein
MTEAKSSLWTVLIVVAVVQSAALLKMVYDRDRLLKTGREITIPVQPLDPRDLFRGNYVTLGYDFTSLRKSSLAPLIDLEGYRAGSDVYVTLHPGAAGAWTVAALTAAYPRDVATGDVVIKGRVKSVWQSENKADALLTVRYGIEAYFVPEGTGRTLETEVREHKIEAIVAVDASGTAALKGLVIDGERHVDPPLL